MTTIIAAFSVGARVCGIRPDLSPAHHVWQPGGNTLLVDDARAAELARCRPPVAGRLRTLVAEALREPSAPQTIR
ncbi:hypothetical protein O7622_23080 [Micromonospora sp. WMMD1076]|uniref:hypothetical protein n=1 Tax=Micromonospora TaxID=1873 RepID=UPI00249C5FD6|nr:hypothetical protein [Micromonospora sp. WMMD1076]WFF05927.1 hypothetical protein O7622_23080 [Micromonospora sp. WMMD1076]